MTILPGESPEGLEQPTAAPRVVTIRPETVLQVLGIAVLVVLGLLLVYLAWNVLTWILVAVVRLCAQPCGRGARAERARSGVRGWHRLHPRALGHDRDRIPDRPAAPCPGDRVETAPDCGDDLTWGQGGLGWLQDDYQIADRVREAVEAQGASGVLGLGLPILDVVRSVVTAVVGVITIVFLTFFMLLEGPRTIRGALDLLPPAGALRAGGLRHLPDDQRLRHRQSPHQPHRRSVFGGSAFRRGKRVCDRSWFTGRDPDLIPLAGATLAAIIVSTVVLLETDWLRTILVIGFFLVYQQIENHVLQPLVYGRTVQLSPLTVLLAVLIGAQLAGVLGALMAIPVAGTLLAIGRELLHYRRTASIETPPGVDLDHRPADNRELSTGTRGARRRVRLQPSAMIRVTRLRAVCPSPAQKASRAARRTRRPGSPHPTRPAR